MNLLLNSVLLLAVQGGIRQTEAPVSTAPVEAAASGLGWSFCVVIAAVICLAAALAMFFITRKEEPKSDTSDTENIKNALNNIIFNAVKELKSHISAAVNELKSQNTSDWQQQSNPQEELLKAVQEQLETITSTTLPFFTAQLTGVQDRLDGIEGKVLAPQILKQMKDKGIPTDLAQIDAVFGFANGFKAHYAMQGEDWEILTLQLMDKINADMDKTALTKQVNALSMQVSNLTQEKATLSVEKTNLQQTKSTLEQQVAAKDQAIKALQAEKAQSDKTWQDMVNDQKTDFDNQLAEEQNAHNAAMQKLNGEHQEAVKKLTDAFDKLVSPDVQKLFGIGIDQEIDKSVLRPMYSYLCLLAELRTNVFANRFGVFDKDLRSSFEGQELAAIRQKIEEDLNPRIESAEYKIHWPAVGERYDEEIHRSESDYGQSISEVKTAVIYRLKDGEFQRESKANVVTG